MKLESQYTCECGKTVSLSNKEAHETSTGHQHYLFWGRSSSPVPRDKKYTCECGRTVSLSMKRNHEDSFGHKNYRRIQALLKEPHIALEDVAMRTGVSRQYIHQIAKATQKHWSGRERRKTYISKRTSDFQKTLDKDPGAVNPLFLEISNRCRKLGYHFQLIYLHSRGGAHISSVLINGYRCHVGVLSTQSSYLRFGEVNPGMDFLLKKSPLDNAWWIFPVKEVPRKGSSFSSGEISSERPGTKSDKHDYFKYKEAWELLKTDRLN